MTKERKLAIEMWEGIRDMLISSHNIASKAIIEYKFEFCEQHELDWMNNCWFCEYIPSCRECPLCVYGGFYGDYSDCRDYNTATASYLNKSVRIEACNNIIKSLGVKHEFVE